MGCCSSRGIASPLFEELIYKIGNQQGVNGLKCVELIEELKKKNLIDSNGGEIMKSLFTPLLYPEGMPIVKTEENKITEAFLSFDNKDIVVTNPSLFVLQYCISFSSSSDQIKTKIYEIDEILSKENANTLENFEIFITEYLKFNFSTIIQNVYDYCNSNRGKKIFAFEIDEQFMKEFSKFKVQVFTQEKIKAYLNEILKTLNEEGLGKTEKIPFETLSKLNTTSNNTLFILQELHSDFIEKNGIQENTEKI